MFSSQQTRMSPCFLTHLECYYQIFKILLTRESFAQFVICTIRKNNDKSKSYLLNVLNNNNRVNHSYLEFLG